MPNIRRKKNCAPRTNTYTFARGIATTYVLASYSYLCCTLRLASHICDSSRCIFGLILSHGVSVLALFRLEHERMEERMGLIRVPGRLRRAPREYFERAVFFICVAQR